MKRNVELALLGHVLNPFHWPALGSSTYSRSDLAAKYYDKILFRNAPIRCLATNNCPCLVINSTDVDTGTRLSLTQDFLTCSLPTWPLSNLPGCRGVFGGSGRPLADHPQ